MPPMLMTQDEDPRAKLKAEIGDLSSVSVFTNKVLVAVYVRPNKTKSGIFLSDKTVEEDRYQGKVGLVLKMGPAAFVEKEPYYWPDGQPIKTDDWVFFRPSDGLSVTINGTLCRMIDDYNIIGTAGQPDQIW